MKYGIFGAIIGDIAGSIYEFNNIKSKRFPMFPENARCTDDTAMTIAVASALLQCDYSDLDWFRRILVEEMQRIGRKYPYAGYGERFSAWLKSRNPKPYQSYGNGSAMRVSPCALAAKTLEEALILARASAEVTHDHPEGIRGAEAQAAAVWLAANGAEKDEIRSYIEENYYALDFTLEEIRPEYSFDVSCKGSVPQAIEAFLESRDFEDAVRNAVSIGGDSDTIASMTGAIAWSYYGREEITVRMDDLRTEAADRLPDDFTTIAVMFQKLEKR